MLKKITRKTAGFKGSYAVVASQYNEQYVDAMLAETQVTLLESGARKVRIYRVPGSFEIPVVAARLAHDGKYDAIVCLGVILRGATTHAQHIGESVSAALAQIQVEYLVPVIHEVLLLENETQADERCLGKRYNRGREAAQTAVAMARLMKTL